MKISFLLTGLALFSGVISAIIHSATCSSSMFNSFYLCLIRNLYSAPVDNEWLSRKILQDSGKILQDDTSSCKIFCQNLARSCKITLCVARILQDNHSSCKYANKWNMIEQDQNETRTLLPINFFLHCDA